jgi:hypothetical protein
MTSPNTSVNLPRDLDNSPIQVMAPSTIVNAAIGAASVATAIPTGAEILDIGASTDAWILFGTGASSVSNSTGMFMPKGVAIYRVPTGATHLCHIQDSVAGRISLTRLI